MSSNWKKFTLVVLVIFSILYVYGLSIPEVKKGLGTTDTITVFIGVLACGYYVLRNKSVDVQILTKSQKLAANFTKFGIIVVALILVWMLYIVVKGS